MTGTLSLCTELIYRLLYVYFNDINQNIANIFCSILYNKLNITCCHPDLIS